MTVGTVINIALWLFTIAGYVIYNLYQKNTKLEGIVRTQEEVFHALKQITEESDKRLKDMDAKGIFQSDDEVGTFFKTIMTLQGILNEYFKVRW